ncbi:MAG TPA: sugar phosphate isomerase/epimerase [Firmicutes bacterium]|nr:sugar phosphate isomerase/epimerase [Bacillota bacterium]
MKDSIYKYIKVGIIHFMAYPQVIRGEGPILETLSKIAEDDYFNVVEVSWMKDPAVRKAAKEMLDVAHMTVAYGGQPRTLTTGLDINSLDTAIREKTIATLKEGIDEAYELGAVGFAFLAGKYPGKDKEEAATQALIDSIKELCAYSKSKGNIPVILEIFDRDIEKKSLVGPNDVAIRVASEVRKEYDNFGLMVDLSHVPQLRQTPREALVPVKDYLMHVHIGNAVLKDKSHPAYGDAHPRFGIAGGENDVPEVMEFLKVLFEIGYLSESGPRIVSFEVKPLAGESPELVIANAKRTLNEAWARL